MAVLRAKFPIPDYPSCPARSKTKGQEGVAVVLEVVVLVKVVGKQMWGRMVIDGGGVQRSKEMKKSSGRLRKMVISGVKE